MLSHQITYTFAHDESHSIKEIRKIIRNLKENQISRQKFNFQLQEKLIKNIDGYALCFLNKSILTTIKILIVSDSKTTFEKAKDICDSFINKYTSGIKHCKNINEITNAYFNEQYNSSCKNNLLFNGSKNIDISTCIKPIWILKNKQNNDYTAKDYYINYMQSYNKFIKNDEVIISDYIVKRANNTISIQNNLHKLLINDDFVDRLLKLYNKKTFPNCYLINADNKEIYLNYITTIIQLLNTNKYIENNRIAFIKKSRFDKQSTASYINDIVDSILNYYNNSAICIEFTENDDTYKSILHQIINHINTQKFNIKPILIIVKDDSLGEQIIKELNFDNIFKINEPKFTKEETKQIIKQDFDRFGNLEKQVKKSMYSASDIIILINKLKVESSLFDTENTQKKHNHNIILTKQPSDTINNIKKPSSLKTLESMIGLEDAKKTIKKIIANNQLNILRNKQTNKSSFNSNINMAFTGNPGTAKTTVAKLYKEILQEAQIIKGNYIEITRADVIGYYAGETDVKTKKLLEKARNGILFIDEAYSLVEKWSDGFRGKGGQVIDAIVSEMSTKAHNIMFIFAGYPKQMEEFLDANEALRSKISYHIAFEDYSPTQLYEIFIKMASDKNLKLTPNAKKTVKKIFLLACNQYNYGNGRFAENLLDQALLNQSERLLEKKDFLDKSSLGKLIKQDFNVNLLQEFGININNSSNPYNELKSLIGLNQVKKEVTKTIARNILDAKRADLNPNYNAILASNMIFNGNPGTAKTTVARLYADILRSEGVKGGRFIECSASDFIGMSYGQDEKNTENLFNKACGGILFIDEAYSLIGHSNIINEINRYIENNRNDTIFIFAGYKKEMQLFLKQNPGLKSRIGCYIDFPDYNPDELLQIFEKLSRDNNFALTRGAVNKASNIFKKAYKIKDFGNGRFCRNLLDRSILNQSLRLWNNQNSHAGAKLPNKSLFRLQESDIDNTIINELTNSKANVGFIQDK